MSPAVRKSMYLPEHIETILDVREETGDTLSGRVAAVIDRYSYIVSQSAVAMSRQEWCLVMDACNGWASWAAAGETLMTAIAVEVEDHVGLNGADEKWELTPEQARSLVQRLAALTPAQTMHVIECIERFWRRCELSIDEALAAAGCRVEP